MSLSSFSRCLFAITLISALTTCDGVGGGSNKGYTYRTSKEGNKINEDVIASGKNPLSQLNEGESSSLQRGLGISAWGIVTIILFLILTIMGLYYFSMCYPILCKKERNYDIIELPKV